MRMFEVAVSTTIDAPAETVWAILTDLSRFAEWNPFVCEAQGVLRVGATVRVRVQPSIRGVHLAFRPDVLACVEPHEIRWRGRFLAEWLGRGDHLFAIEPAGPGRVRFVQREAFSGILPRLARGLLERETRRGFELMNRALKERAERAHSAPERAACAPARGVGG